MRNRRPKFRSGVLDTNKSGETNVSASTEPRAPARTRPSRAPIARHVVIITSRCIARAFATTVTEVITTAAVVVVTTVFRVYYDNAYTAKCDGAGPSSGHVTRRQPTTTTTCVWAELQAAAVSRFTLFRVVVFVALVMLSLL